MPISNKTLNVVLGVIDVIIIAFIIYMFSAIKATEKSKIYFTESDISNVNWVLRDPAIRFEVTSSKISLTIDDEEIIKDASYELNIHTGEIVYTQDGTKHTGELYLRSAAESNIVLWYNKHEYHLQKEVIYH